MIAIEKISLAQYQKDRLDTAPGTQMTLPQLEEEYAGIILPRRGTLVSAGYDFHTPFSLTLEPGETLVVPTASGPSWRMICGWESTSGPAWDLSMESAL